MKYRVSVKETSYGSVVVEADSEDEAHEKAYEEYCNGNVHCNKSDVEIGDITNEELAIVDYIDRCMCYIHSLKKGEPGVLAEATIISKLNDQQFVADYNGVRCTAIFNPFVGTYYVDDLYGVLPAGYQDAV